jgi:hypothetical protein
MFNVFQYDRELKNHEQQAKLRKNHSMLEIRRKKNDSILLKNYEYRVDKFLKTSINNPIIHHDYFSPLQIVPRESNPEKFLGRRVFMIRGFKTEKDRIQSSVNSQEILDTQPLKTWFPQRSQQQFLIRQSFSVKPEKKFPVLRAESENEDKIHQEQTSDTSLISQKCEKNRYNKTHFKALIHKLIKEKPLDQFYKKKDSILVSLPGTFDPLIEFIQNSNTKFKHLFQPISMKVLEASNIVHVRNRKKFLRKGEGLLKMSKC